MVKNKENSPAVAEEKIVNVVEKKIDQLVEKGNLDLPDDYSPGNAMRAAYLALQETKDNSGKPALKVCSRESIMNSLLHMVVMGLNPLKKQCDFIVYGSKLVCQPEYFGNIALCKRLAGAREVDPQVVFEGDELDYEFLPSGKIKLNGHKQEFQNRMKDIVGAYCVITFENGRPDHVELMTIDQIKQAWKQGRTYKEGGNGTHQKFTEEMAKKTVVNRATKRFINSSSDAAILEAVNSYSETRAEQEVQQEIEEEANQGEVIDVQPSHEEGNGETEQPQTEEEATAAPEEHEAPELEEAETEPEQEAEGNNDSDTADEEDQPAQQTLGVGSNKGEEPPF